MDKQFGLRCLILCIFVTKMGLTTSSLSSCIILSDRSKEHECIQYTKQTTVEAASSPWVVSLKDTGYGTHRHFCCGSIIGIDWVLTTAYCVRNYLPKDIKIVAGESDMLNHDGYEQTAYVQTIHIHPKFYEFTMENDIALLKLNSSLSFDDDVNAAHLSEYYDITSHGDMVTYGWGLQSDLGIPMSVLKQSTMIMQPKGICIEAYLGMFFKDMLCVTNKTEHDNSPCLGDWGGPLMYLGQAELIGIASWSNGCGMKKYPTIFTNVSFHYKWIKAVIENMD